MKGRVGERKRRERECREEEGAVKGQIIYAKAVFIARSFSFSLISKVSASFAFDLARVPWRKNQNKDKFDWVNFFYCS